MKTNKAYQKDLFDKRNPIETVVITPTKYIPLSVYKQCWHLAYFMELMERLPDGRVLWDEERSDFYDESLIEAEYIALQNGWLTMDMELPKAFVAKMEGSAIVESANKCEETVCEELF